MDTPGLRELQGELWRAIATEPGTLGAGPALLAASAPSRTLDAEGRLRVYADAYFLRLRDVLVEDFPRLAAALGEARFAALARAYLRRHPSVDPSVRHLGDALPDFVATDDALPAWAGDLARLERARTNVFDAADDTPIGLEQLRGIDAGVWPQLRFTPIRALACLRLAWPAHAVWQDVEAAPRAPVATAVRVWRGADYRVFHAPMEPRAAAALQRLTAGEPFAAVCAAFDDLAYEDGARQAVALLARWLDDGIIAGVTAATA